MPVPGAANITNGVLVSLTNINQITLSSDKKTVSIGSGSSAHVWPQETEALLMEKNKYKECLVHLAMSFSGIIGRLDAALRSDLSLFHGSSRYSPLLLRNRNAELLGLILLILAAMNLQPNGFNQLFVTVRQVRSQNTLAPCPSVQKSSCFPCLGLCSFAKATIHLPN